MKMKHKVVFIIHDLNTHALIMLPLLALYVYGMVMNTKSGVQKMP